MGYDEAIDKGLEGVTVCTTKISSIIDTDLYYRGYIISDLMSYSFEEVVFLLLNGKLPDKNQLLGFKKSISTQMTLDDKIVDQLKLLPLDCHPMAFLRTAVSIVSTYSHNENETLSCYSLIARMGMLVALFERLRNSKDIVKPNLDKGIAWKLFVLS